MCDSSCVSGLSLSQAVGSAQKFYNNEHIYPYMYLAGFHYRHRDVREALKCWSEAAQVMQEWVTTAYTLQVKSENE